jgi:predicted metal-dependent HD superfamily phosphohydrolase
MWTLMIDLKKEFTTLTQNYTQDKNLINTSWQKIESAYERREYHNLSHLENMYVLLCEVKSEIEDWECLMYAMFYHDFIYDASRNDNEKRSADLSKGELKKLSVPSNEQKKVYRLIMATKGHSEQKDKDGAFFVDVDLAILGMSDYDAYTLAIRKEYAVFSDKVYVEGRKKVIGYFLAQKRIYNSDYFYDKFELSARDNLQKEYAILQEQILAKK